MKKKAEWHSTCTVVENGVTCGARSVGRDLCRKHYQRWWKTGSTGLGKVTRCSVPSCPKRGPYVNGLCSMHKARLKRHGTTDPNPARRSSDNPSAATIHKRLRDQRGKARTHPCAGGCGKQAFDWAFDEPTGYSTDLSRYRPLCRKCHVKSDGRLSAERRSA